ncbi:MAG: thioredoxin family protein [Rhodospirillaceae bacterium]
MAVATPVCDFGWRAVDFSLPGTDGRTWTLAEVAGSRGTLVMFLCNHCPYVKAVIGPLVEEVAALKALGVGAVAIMSNDAGSYPEDSFENMTLFAAAHGFGFPYLYDQSQAVARAYDAVCTPDFFGFDAGLGLQYRGRFDASGRQATPGARRELVVAMTEIAITGQGPASQTPSMGCSIKWRS